MASNIGDSFPSERRGWVIYAVWIETELGPSSTLIALMFALSGLANVIAGPRSGRLSDRIGARRESRCGSVIP